MIVQVESNKLGDCKPKAVGKLRLSHLDWDIVTKGPSEPRYHESVCVWISEDYLASYCTSSGMLQMKLDPGYSLSAKTETDFC